MALSLFERVTVEILDFHRFFVAWYDAATAGSTDFDRCERVFGPGFHMLPPTGKIFDRLQAIDLIRANRATFNGDFFIEIIDIVPIWQEAGAIAVTYVEKQERAGVKTSRRASALFTESSSAPNGVEWRHLHETWMQTAE